MNAYEFGIVFTAQMMEKGQFCAATTKRPSRRHRRRPSRLAYDYGARSARRGWLTTHIWHAKRFRIAASLYGHRIPLRPSDKGSRAAHRAATKHCTLQVLPYIS